MLLQSYTNNLVAGAGLQGKRPGRKKRNPCKQPQSGAAGQSSFLGSNFDTSRLQGSVSLSPPPYRLSWELQITSPVCTELLCFQPGQSQAERPAFRLR